MKIYIAYGSTDGQTAKICEFVKNELVQSGYDVCLNDAKHASDLEDFDLFVIGASVHLGNYQKSVRNLIRKYNHVLNERPSAFLSVSLTAAGSNEKDLAELDKITKDFLSKTSWNPLYTLQVAGALRYSQYNFLTKFIMKRIARKSGGGTDTSRDYEYTDWDQLKKFSHSFVKDHEFAFN